MKPITTAYKNYLLLFFLLPNIDLNLLHKLVYTHTHTHTHTHKKTTGKLYILKCNSIVNN